MFISLYFSIKAFFSFKKHLFMMLLSLEFSMLIICLVLMNFLGDFGCDIYLITYFIVFMVCEAVLGLVLLTLVVRSYGSDYLKSLSLMLC
uniref:NADH-ubiquinone oxidoreductase chain 4L n=1 Tax=Agonoscena pistaciae TaxID=1635299 RepID=A0A8F2PTI2_9HEMI|nr:NADH dehydrogenase subunit 4L [Agonoscena pistaciae]